MRFVCLPLVLQEEFDKDLIPIEESFKPLVLKCKELGRAMRIGTNHGSLSARVLSYYGDTPRGMVESAVEFANICRCVVGSRCVMTRAVVDSCVTDSMQTSSCRKFAVGVTNPAFC